MSEHVYIDCVKAVYLFKSVSLSQELIDQEPNIGFFLLTFTYIHLVYCDNFICKI